ncbi:MAG: GDP-mannose 4,6-dehydratase [Leptospirales bacterium]|nr:GDP-mannose 4,6-dehydratase [Leptospirales bacterium]
MRIVITGFAGFVSGYFIEYLEKNKIRSEILGIDINQSIRDYQNYEYSNVKFKQIDLLDTEVLEDLIYQFQPEYLLHLASYSSVGFSWKNPVLSFRNNINIFLNLMEIIRRISSSCRILSVGSAEEYGIFDETKLPLREEYPLQPLSPYAVARVSQENLSKVYSDGYGLDIIMTRSFNHIGPGQKDIFVISSFAKQLVDIKRGLKKEKKLITGDISIIRDFLDVRDVVDAYYKLLIDGQKGEVYNVCSGRGLQLSNIIDIFCSILNISVELEIDQGLIRPNENKIIFGANEKLKNTTGWENRIELNDSLRDIIEYWDGIV